MNSLTTHINRGHFNLSCTTHLLSICLLVRRHCHASVHSPSPGPHRYVPLVAHVSIHTFPSNRLACDLCTLTGQVIGETLGTTNEFLHSMRGESKGEKRQQIIMHRHLYTWIYDNNMHNVFLKVRILMVTETWRKITLTHIPVAPQGSKN